MKRKLKRESAVALGNELYDVGWAVKNKYHDSRMTRDQLFKMYPRHRVAWRAVGEYVKRNFVRKA